MENSKLSLDKTRMAQLQDDQLDALVGGVIDIDVDANSCKRESCNAAAMDDAGSAVNV